MRFRFTAEDAFEASEAGDPIILTALEAANICREHGVSYEDYAKEDATEYPMLPYGEVDAAKLLGWLGY
jgi:hypothetical protein